MHRKENMYEYVRINSGKLKDIHANVTRTQQSYETVIDKKYWLL